MNPPSLVKTKNIASELSDELQQALNTLDNLPEFELSDQEKAEVIAFEQALCRAEFPMGFEFLQTRVTKPQHNIVEIAEPINLKTFVIDWFLQTPEGFIYLKKIGYKKTILNKEIVKKYLAHAAVSAEHKILEESYNKARLWGIQRLQTKLREQLEKGKSNIVDPEYFSVICEPKELVDKITNTKEIKYFYKSIEANLRSQGFTNLVDVKLVMLKIHYERINVLIAMNARDAIVLLQQYKFAPRILSTEDVDKIYRSFEVLKYTDTTDAHKIARIYSMLDKFITGLDIENGFAQISSVIQRLEIAQKNQPEKPQKLSHNKLAEKLADNLVDAKYLKKLFEKVLQTYGLLNKEKHTGKKARDIADDGLWQVIITANKSSLEIDSYKRFIWIPKDYCRNLNQLKPTGTLPLIDHEITHVLQHENAAKLNIGLLEKSRGANDRIWFETGATEEENVAYETLFGINRGDNLHYLRAMQKQLDGAGISECARVFFDSLVSSGDTTNKDTAIKTAIVRTQRLFKNGEDWSPGSGYLTNTQPLEYAELQILRRVMPQDLHWLFFIGRLNFQTLAELHRIGWLKKDDIFVPDKMPSDIVLESLIANEYAHSQL